MNFPTHTALLRYIIDNQPYVHDASKIERFFHVCALNEAMLRSNEDLGRELKYYFGQADGEHISLLYWRNFNNVEPIHPLALSPTAMRLFTV